jgi:hypothetical protein
VRAGDGPHRGERVGDREIEQDDIGLERADGVEARVRISCGADDVEASGACEALGEPVAVEADRAHDEDAVHRSPPAAVTNDGPRSTAPPFGAIPVPLPRPSMAPRLYSVKPTRVSVR